MAGRGSGPARFRASGLQTGALARREGLRFAEQGALAEIDVEIEDVEQCLLGLDFFDDQIDTLAFKHLLEILQIDIGGRLRQFAQHGFCIDFDELEMLFRERALVEVEALHLIQREAEAECGQAA